jgi:hypothetical protein
MIHVEVFMSSKPLDKHGPLFERLRMIAKTKSGIDIPIKEDISEWKYSDNLKMKPTIIMVITDGDKKNIMLWTESAYNKYFLSIKLRMKGRYKDPDIEFFRSDSKRLNALTIKKTISNSWGYYPLSNPKIKEIFDDAMKTATKVGEIKSEETAA